jgi:hypothetical protein
MRRHDYPVMHPSAFSPNSNDASAPEVCQVPGNLRLGLAEDFDEIAYTDFLVAHEIEQAKACVVAKGVKEALEVES